MNIEHEVTMNNQCWVIEHDEGSMSAAMVIMVHQQYWSSSNNDAATDAILSAYMENRIE